MLGEVRADWPGAWEKVVGRWWGCAFAFLMEAKLAEGKLEGGASSWNSE